MSHLFAFVPFAVASVHNIFPFAFFQSLRDAILAQKCYLQCQMRKLVKTSDDVESDMLEQGIRDSFVKMIKKREEKVKMGKLDNYGNDFFGSLLQAYHDTDKTKKISIDDMIDECKTFYIAGHETTTSLLTWTILLLAIHTDWQEKLRSWHKRKFLTSGPGM